MNENVFTARLDQFRALLRKNGVQAAIVWISVYTDLQPFWSGHGV